jgi:hypothetical protein
MLEISHNLLEQSESFAELLTLVFSEPTHCVGKGVHAAIARFPHQANPFGRSFEADAAAVFGGVPAYEASALESGDDAAHGGRADLLGISELAERFGSAEDENGEGGKLGGADASFAIADAKAAEEVDGGGMELVGDFNGCGIRRRMRRSVGRLCFFVLDRRHWKIVSYAN